MRKKEWRKPNAGRRGQTSSERHWLGEGVAGQESLLMELTPALYALDQTLASVAGSVAHRAGSEKPFAIFVPPEGTVGWQLGYLSKKFRIYLWSEASDEFVEAAADHFGAKLVEGDLEESIENEVELFVCTSSCWHSEAHFIEGVRDALKYLAPGGSACFVVEGTGAEGDIRLAWDDETETPLRALIEGSLFRLPAVGQVHTASLNENAAGDADSITAFLKRSREFFGRHCRELLLQRLWEPDFGPHPVEAAGGEPLERWGVLLVWPGLHAEKGDE